MMATCKEDCLCSPVCKLPFNTSEIKVEVAHVCHHFKNKADFVELPCVAMVEQFIKDGKFDKKRTAHNGRFAVVYIDKSKWNCCPLIDITEQFYNTEKALERIQALKEGAK